MMNIEENRSGMENKTWEENNLLKKLKESNFNKDVIKGNGFEASVKFNKDGVPILPASWNDLEEEDYDIV